MKNLLVVLALCSQVSILSAQEFTRIITDQDLGSESYFWSSDTTYVLDGLIFLETGGSLDIAPGTRIEGRMSPSNGDPTSALIVTAGASLKARGEYLLPIVFTAETSSIGFGNQDPSGGQWGGLILLGSADSECNGDPCQIESLTEDPRLSYGSDQPSGSRNLLTYVSIRHAGAGDLPGLTLAGLSKKNRLYGIEVFACAAGGVQFLGGDIDSRYLTGAFISGSTFAWDQGYSGKGQYWFALMSSGGSVALDGRGSSRPLIYNSTLLGPGTQGSPTTLAVRLSDGARIDLGMSVIADFPNKGILVEDLPGDGDSYAGLNDGSLTIASSLWSDFGGGNAFAVADGLVGTLDGYEDPDAQALTQHLMENNVVTERALPYLSREQNQRLNPDVFETDLFPDFLYPVDTFILEFTNFCSGFGAFVSETGAWWLQHWTALDQMNYLMHPCFLQFIESTGLEFRGDTLITTCESLADLFIDDEFFLCLNDGCIFPNLQPALVMRRRRKRSIDPSVDNSFCWRQEIEFELEEFIIIPEPFSLSTFIGQEPFTISITAEIIDTISPFFEFIPCDTCALGLDVVAIDCDTIGSFRSGVLSLGDTTQHFWEASDRCGNFSRFEFNTGPWASSQTLYRDRDGDGIGIDEFSIQLAGDLVGFVPVSGDCDDSDPRRFPGNTNVNAYNIDHDCDGRGQIEKCEGSDVLIASAACEYERYPWNPSFVEKNSKTDCRFFEFYMEGDVWLRTVVPASGELLIQHQTQFPAFELDVLRGACNSLEIIQCNPFGSESDSLNLTDLQPGDTIVTRFTWSDTEANPLEICFSDPVSTTDIEEFGNEDLHIFPNPSDGLLQMAGIQDCCPLTSIRIVNAAGVEVARFEGLEMRDVLDTKQMDLRNLSPGLYFARLQSSLGQHVEKIILH